ncbi:MAG TPA: PAS domain S-box protein, partial [Acidimicrobiia bacterium]
MGKRATSAARRSRPGRRELLAALDSWDVAVVASSPEGEITSWNGAAARIFGYQPDEVLGQPITLLVPSDDQKAAEAVLARARDGERVNDIRARQRRKDGGLVSVTMSVSPVVRRGAVVSIVVAARDLRAQRQAEKALLKKAGELQGLVSAIVESSDEAIVGLDPDLVVM